MKLLVFLRLRRQQLTQVELDFPHQTMGLTQFLLEALRQLLNAFKVSLTFPRAEKSIELNSQLFVITLRKLGQVAR